MLLERVSHELEQPGSALRVHRGGPPGAPDALGDVRMLVVDDAATAHEHLLVCRTFADFAVAEILKVLESGYPAYNKNNYAWTYRAPVQIRVSRRSAVGCGTKTAPDPSRSFGDHSHPGRTTTSQARSGPRMTTIPLYASIWR